MRADDLNAAHHVTNVVTPGTAVTRRRFLELLAATGAGAMVVSSGASAAAASWLAPAGEVGAASATVFPSGVMAGDPTPTGSVLWTQVSRPANGATVPVTWEVATDASFGTVVAGGAADALDSFGHCVKVAVGGLAADRWYHYRFTAGDTTSTIGRLRTAPAAGSTPDQLRFAWASCQQRSSPYTAHRRIADEPDLDYWIHLGDYVYVSDGSTLTVDNYRGVYATFKSNADLQALQAAVPTVAMYDDGEFVNGVHRGIPAERLAAALQVWFEQFPVIPPDTEATRAHRHLNWGNLVETFMLDVRQYRDAEVPEGDTFSAADRERFNPERTTLGAAQRQWLADGLTGSDATWKVLGNPYNFAMWRLGPKVVPRGEQRFTSDFRDLNNVHLNQGAYAPNEAWDDFWFERRQLLNLIAAAGVDNVISVSGHTHIWLADVVQPDPDDPNSPVVAFDFTCGSLTADPDFANLNFGGISFGGNADAAYPNLQRVARAIEGQNPWKAYVNFINQGYGVATFTPGQVVIEFKAVNTYDPDAAADVLARFTIADGARRMRVELWPAPCYTCSPTTPPTPVVPSQMFPPALPYAGFSDVAASAGFSTAVNWLAVNDITTGVGGRRFDPAGSVTRRQMALFLWRMMDQPTGSPPSGFADIPATGQLATAINWMEANGITQTTTPPGQPRRFRPDELVNRAQMAAFLWRLAGEPTGSPPSGFTDVPAGAFFRSAVDWLAHWRITTGIAGSDRYDPAGRVTRAQMAQFLWRLASTTAAWSPTVALPTTVRSLA